MIKNKMWVLIGLGLLLTMGSNILLWSMYGMQIYNVFILILTIIAETILISSVVLLVKRVSDLSLQVIKDPLTEIYNRKYFMDTLENEIARARRSEHTMAMILFDIDDFKHVNDNYGHYIGDQVLINISYVVNKIIRQYDIFGRLGGEEFAIILPEVDEQDALDLCERIRTKVEEVGFTRKIPITISIGIALLEGYDDHHALYQKSDEAMYQAKRSGKNQVVLFQ